MAENEGPKHIIIAAGPIMWEQFDQYHTLCQKPMLSVHPVMVCSDEDAATVYASTNWSKMCRECVKELPQAIPVGKLDEIHIAFPNVMVWNDLMASARRLHELQIAFSFAEAALLYAQSAVNYYGEGSTQHADWGKRFGVSSEAMENIAARAKAKLSAKEPADSADPPDSEFRRI
jgi:hypothetical protein